VARLLILGGTQFLGRHIVEAAQTAGHELTLFNRGQTNPGLFPGIEQVHGDRDGGLGPLAGRRWDAVVDVAGYVPRIVRQSAELLANAVERYVFISTISVYAEFPRPGLDETAPVGRLEDESTEAAGGASYGPLKALCERAVEAALPGRALVIRPGLIVGPHDPTDRFTYWPVRVARGGEVLAPEGPHVPVQVIDARDLAAWTVRMVEARATGTFNATGPAAPLTLDEALETCRQATRSDATFTWAPEEFLVAQGVSPWMGLPLWLPAAGQDMSRVSIARALAAGLTFRPLAETVRATLDWYAMRPAGPMRAGLAEEKERSVLAAWREQVRGPR
jgi:2'-hydroxyisoflavone reductase